MKTVMMAVVAVCWVGCSSASDDGGAPADEADTAAPRATGTGDDVSAAGDTPGSGEGAWDPPQAEGTLRLWTGEMTIPAGDEMLFCTAFDKTTEEMWVNRIQGFQRKGGHHTSLLYNSKTERPVGISPCTDDDMTSNVYVGTGNTVYDDENPLNLNGGMDLPEGMALRVPKGAQLIVQSHYVNYTAKDLVWTDAIDVSTIPKGQVTTSLGTFQAGTANFEIPAGGTFGVDVECEIDETMTLLSLAGHTHRYGTLFQVRHERAGKEVELYNETNGWQLETDAPSIATFPSGGPLTFEKGDILRIRCEWENTSDHDIGFPEEMCGLSSKFYPGEGVKFCASAGTTENCGGGTCLDGQICCINGVGGGECTTKELCETGWSCADQSDCNDTDICCQLPVVGTVCRPETECPGVTPCPTDGSECFQVSDLVTVVCCEDAGVCNFDFMCGQ